MKSPSLLSLLAIPFMDKPAPKVRYSAKGEPERKGTKRKRCDKITKTRNKSKAARKARKKG